ncbi:MAG: MerR family transcriptional regulator [Gammaproteobacteria bacterium]|nr:MerR family transcriptional regulator [Gammaproteobacteria bacterium]
MSDPLTRQNLVKISAASHLSGIRIETLRAWDKRGQFVPTRRVGNARYYTQAQVERMKDLNTLIQSGIGYTIGDLCEQSNSQISQLVADLHATPKFNAVIDTTDEPNAVIVGWRLMALRNPSLEKDSIRTIAPNIEDIDSFYQYLRRLDHDGLRLAVVELPATWNLNYINKMRDKVDALNQSDCHIIAVSFMNDPSSFKRYLQEAQQKGVSLLDGSNLDWQSVLDEISSVLVMRADRHAPAAVAIPANELARLSQSTRRLGGVAIADIATLYQRTADVVGLANREAQNHPFEDKSQLDHLTHRLNTIHAELAACIDLIRDLAKEPSSYKLDKTKQ